MKSLIPALFTVGALMVLFGAAVYITGWEVAPYVYTIGATMVALAQINSPSKSSRANVNASAANRFSVRCCWCSPAHSCFSLTEMSGLCA